MTPSFSFFPGRCRSYDTPSLLPIWSFPGRWRVSALLLLWVALFFLQGPGEEGLSSLQAEQGAEVRNARQSVVKIQTTFFQYDYSKPWKQPHLRESGGTGFIIEGNRIVTNAHVVSQANTIRVQRPGQRTDYPARLLHIAHDCDLAMLEVKDPAFFQDSRPLEVGETPELNSPVVVVGFPIGGDRVSITRGIVSRMDVDTYSHSRIDQHLTIQVDAAINPGNSGGPALQDGKVIGVAFQVLTSGENLGYLIPPPVIRKFLEDVKDGVYDGYTEFGTLHIPTTNPVLRRTLGLERVAKVPDTGVYIYDVIPGSSAHGNILPGDVLLSLNGHTISENGDVEVKGQLFSFTELVDNFAPGISIRAEVLREGEKKSLVFPAKITHILDFQRNNYDTPPVYYLVGGLLFQPLDANLMQTYARLWASNSRTEILYRYRFYLSHALYKERKRDVIFTRRLGDRVNLYARESIHRIVESVNGEPVTDFVSFVKLADRHVAESPYLVLRFQGESKPVVMRSSDIRAANPAILRRYSILEDRYLPAGGEP